MKVTKANFENEDIEFIALLFVIENFYKLAKNSVELSKSSIH